MPAEWGAQQWDFNGLSTGKYETNEHTFSDSFQNISIAIDTADVTFLPSADVKTSVVCFERENEKHAVTVEDDTLVIALVDTKEWYEYIGFYFKTPKITVYLPESEYNNLSVAGDTGDVQIPADFRFESIAVAQSTGDVTNYASAAEIAIATSTGNIQVENIETNNLQLSVTTGKVAAANVICHEGVRIDVSTGKTDLSNVRCKNFISNGNTGDITLTEVVAVEKLTIERTTGDVTFRSADASQISVKTDTGEVIGSLLTDKIFITETDTGDVDVPKTFTGGKCEITTDTGDIKISIKS